MQSSNIAEIKCYTYHFFTGESKISTTGGLERKIKGKRQSRLEGVQNIISIIWIFFRVIQ